MKNPVQNGIFFMEDIQVLKYPIMNGFIHERLLRFRMCIFMLYSFSGCETRRKENPQR
jgi:hypothetical protein